MQFERRAGQGPRSRWVWTAAAYISVVGLLFGGTFLWFGAREAEERHELEERFSRRVAIGAEFIASYLKDVAGREALRHNERILVQHL